ncbi:lantibiotic immunity ABC transporter MutE/EpiE family permease subunit [Paramaledivibacter caminithermalis]|jgi:ABC-2 type transport system permease protein|uniref:ABC-2 type transport system permease protein n=1 Tax=Paramaledivibacter caminithermalis (strain DSM 15212 / CIP 107654 / DViRD3) TaxID=1121301 RepID=A0A1M6TJF1_PARC5|nr:lantibiotic immunity ABC transporter MutE/EpiE family permease subunit [Paramaledivibacter caminithermalis]SHK57067.1 ABC-2 type transport system permease protein [Paramaledivibacter caminithermalis DSM 15212]
MINVIKSEYLKYKRTFTKKLILMAPLLFILIALPQKLFMLANYLRPWQLLLNQIYNWWPLIFIPLGMALFAALLELQERKAGNYRNIRVHNVSPSFIWIGKVIVMAIYSLLSTLVLIVAIIISGLITAGADIPWGKIFAGGFTIWLTALALIPLQLWMAAWKGTFASMALGFLGMITGVIAAPESYWIYIPWSWSIRLMCPIIGVHPNGIPLKASDSLMDTSVIPAGIALSLATLIIFTVITALWFNRREAR